MKNCVRCYVVKKVLTNIAGMLIVLLVASLVLGVISLADLAFRWVTRTYPLFGLILSGEIIWFILAMVVQAARASIAKFVDEAREVCK